MSKSVCLDPCTRTVDEQSELVTCCNVGFGNDVEPGSNWNCSGINWNRWFVNRNVGDYVGVEHDDICKDLGVTVFNERGWDGIDGFTPVKLSR